MVLSPSSWLVSCSKFQTRTDLSPEPLTQSGSLGWISIEFTAPLWSLSGFSCVIEWVPVALRIQVVRGRHLRTFYQWVETFPNVFISWLLSIFHNLTVRSKDPDKQKLSLEQIEVIQSPWVPNTLINSKSGSVNRIFICYYCFFRIGSPTKSMLDR